MAFAIDVKFNKMGVKYSAARESSATDASTWKNSTSISASSVLSGSKSCVHLAGTLMRA